MSWREIALGDAATFINGYAFKPSDWGKNGKEIIRIQNLTGSSKESNYYDGEIKERYIVKSGDLLISWSGTIGIYEWKRADGVLNQHIFKVQFDKEEIDKSFFIHLIGQKLNDLSRATHGSTMKHITKKRFDNVKIPLPPLSTQKKIAQVLDEADAVRQRCKEVLAKYDQLAQSVFLDMFGDPVKNEKGWDKVELQDLGKITSGSTPSRENKSHFSGNIPWVKTGEVNGTVIRRTGENISENALKNSSCKLYDVGAILIAMYGQGKTRGRVGILGVKATTNQACAVIPSSDLINQQFLFAQLKINYKDLRELGRGGNQPNLNTGIVKKYKVISPPIDLQNKFTFIIEQIEQQKELAQQELEKSEELFKSLLQRSFKGELF